MSERKIVLPPPNIADFHKRRKAREAAIHDEAEAEWKKHEEKAQEEMKGAEVVPKKEE
jgi:hypothetical protein